MTAPTEAVPTHSKAAIQSRKWRENNPERYKAGVKKANDERRRDPVKWASKLEQNRAWRKRNAEKLGEYDRSREAIKRRARAQLRDWIYRGKIKRGSCEVCGKPNADAHHHDYTKPLDVRWLCRQHHAEQHHD